MVTTSISRDRLFKLLIVKTGTLSEVSQFLICGTFWPRFLYEASFEHFVTLRACVFPRLWLWTTQLMPSMLKQRLRWNFGSFKIVRPQIESFYHRKSQKLQLGYVYWRRYSSVRSYISTNFEILGRYMWLAEIETIKYRTGNYWIQDNFIPKNS